MLRTFDQLPGGSAAVVLAARAVVVAVAVVVAGCGSSKPAMVQAPNLYIHAEEDPYANVPAELRSNTATVLYATDRKGETVEDVYGYGYTRSREVFYGLCEVRMGDEDMTWEELAEASCTAARPDPIGLTLTKIDERGKYLPLGPMVKVGEDWVENAEEVAAHDTVREDLHALLAERLALTPRKEVFLFVHGYNNSFASGAFRTAQIWHFTGRGGVPVLFSWPAGSTGILQGYTRDRESGEFANPHLKRFIEDIASCPDVKKINLICHSRGTDVLGTAVRELHNETRAAGKSPKDELKIGQWVLAAPDIDLEVFMERFGQDRMGFAAEQVTIYASPNDKAIGLASWLFGSVRRMGQAGFADMDPAIAAAMKIHPVTSIIDMRGKTDKRGHGYFLSSPACLSDLILVLRDGKRPGAANGRPLFDDPEGFWQLRDGYPDDSATVAAAAPATPTAPAAPRRKARDIYLEP